MAMIDILEVTSMKCNVNVYNDKYVWLSLSSVFLTSSFLQELVYAILFSDDYWNHDIILHLTCIDVQVYLF